MRARLWLCVALLVAVAGCGDAGVPAYLVGDASCIGAKVYADEKLIGEFEERTYATSDKFAAARGISRGYEDVPIIPSGAKRVRVVLPMGANSAPPFHQGQQSSTAAQASTR